MREQLDLFNSQDVQEWFGQWDCLECCIGIGAEPTRQAPTWKLWVRIEILRHPWIDDSSDEEGVRTSQSQEAIEFLVRHSSDDEEETLQRQQA
jgi:hypothetical protein